MSRIADVHARQILDSRGNPTIEVDVKLDSGACGRAAIPSGASIGTHEAVELRDGGVMFSGKGVTAAVGNVNGEIAEAVAGRDAADQSALDRDLAVQTYHALRSELHEKGFPTAVGDEGGFAPTGG